ncbi:MAG: right-handed parallel beta-helix repeat-containing protein [Bryobacteraceae bacterium]|jgi:parallel beta-helix repeat protein
MLPAPALAVFLLFSGSPEQHLRKLLAARTGAVQLPSGPIELNSGIALPDGAHDLTIGGDSTTLRASGVFHGRAVLSCRHCRRITVRNLSIDGNRARLEKPLPLPPSGQTFAASFENNGLLFTDTDGITVEHVTLRNIAGFAVLASNVRNLKILHTDVADSGSNTALGHNNTTGGILMEEGSSDFEVSQCTLRAIRGNGIWTHSRIARNANGVIAGNTLAEIGRDAIQVGHATNIRVTGNRGSKIGYPASEIDVETLATPVGIDTAGNVDRSVYEGNHFEEIDGKCIDLDGFHDGAVRDNTCVNGGRAEDYSWGHFGIVMNNSNPDMESRNIVIEGNEISGTKFGGIFVIGTGNTVRGNRLSRINLAHCPEGAARFGCVWPDQPGVLESGIYLGSRAQRPAPARGNVVERNVVKGWRMRARCIGFAPGVSAAGNTIRDNECSDE